MRNKSYQKVLKRVVIFVAPLVLLLSVMSFAQAEEYTVELEDYNLTIGDISGNYYEDTPDGTMEMVLAQDSKGKVTGYGSMYLDLGYGYPDITVYFEVKGKVKGKNDIKTFKFKLKGGGDFYIYGEYYETTLGLSAKLVIDQSQQIMYGTMKAKACIKGEGCVSDEEDFYMDLEDEMTGEAELEINVEPDEEGKKLEGIGYLTIPGYDEYPLYAKGKYNSKNDETKFSLKGVDEFTKGIKFKLKINEGNGDCTFISGKALGQKIIY